MVVRADLVHQIGEHDQWVVDLLCRTLVMIEVGLQPAGAVAGYDHLHSETTVPKATVMSAGITDSSDLVQEGDQYLLIQVISVRDKSSILSQSQIGIELRELPK